MKVRERTGRISLRMCSYPLPNIAINVIEYCGAVDITLDQPTTTWYAVQIPLTGVSEINCRGKKFDSTRDVASVISPADELEMKWRDDCVQVVCRIQHAALEAELASLLGMGVDKVQFHSSLDVRGHDGAVGVGNAIMRLVKRIDRDDPLLKNAAYVRHLEETLLMQLLTEQLHSYSHFLDVEPRPVGPKVVRHALALLRSDPKEYSLAKLARELHVSTRVLQRGFRDYLGTCFRQLSEDCRFQQFNNALKAAIPGEASIYRLMVEYGLPQNGRTFSRYGQIFGETPLATMLNGK